MGEVVEVVWVVDCFDLILFDLWMLGLDGFVGVVLFYVECFDMLIVVILLVDEVEVVLCVWVYGVVGFVLKIVDFVMLEIVVVCVLVGECDVFVDMFIDDIV